MTRTETMNSGIRVCCRCLVMWAGKHRSHQHLTGVAKAIERTKKFIDKALDSYEYALDEETDGRRASEFLIAKGIIKNPKVQLQLSKAPEVDRRTPEEKAMDAKKKALADLVSNRPDRSFWLTNRHQLREISARACH